MRQLILSITTLVVLSCGSLNKVESEEVQTNEQTVLIDTIYSDSYKLTIKDSIWHPFFIEQINDSIRFTAYVDNELKASYTFFEKFRVGRPAYLANFSLDSAILPLPEDYTITKPDIINESYAKANLAFEKLNDTILYIEHWQKDIHPSSPYMIWDEYGESIDSLDENGFTVYPPTIKGYSKSKLVNTNTHQPLPTPDFSLLYKGSELNLLLSSDKISNSYIYSTDREFNIRFMDSSTFDFLNKPEILKTLVDQGGTEHQLANPTQVFKAYEKYVPITFKKGEKSGLYNLKNGKNMHPLSSFSWYHPQKYVGLYLQNDSLFILDYEKTYTRNGVRPIAITDIDSIAHSSHFGLFFNLNDTIPEHSPMHHLWIFKNEKIAGTDWDHNRPYVYVIDENTVYVYNRIIEEYQAEINEYGETAYDENGEVITVGKNYPGRYKSGIFDFKKDTWVIPPCYQWVMAYDTHYIAKKPSLDADGLYIGATYDLYNLEFEKYKSVNSVDDLPEEFRQLMRKKVN